MPKVKLLVARATAEGSENRGDEVWVSDSEMERMVAAGQAVLVREEKRETATRKMPRIEKARK